MAPICVISLALKILPKNFRDWGEANFSNQKHSHRHWVGFNGHFIQSRSKFSFSMDDLFKSVACTLWHDSSLEVSKSDWSKVSILFDGEMCDVNTFWDSASLFNVADHLFYSSLTIKTNPVSMLLEKEMKKRKNLC